MTGGKFYIEIEPHAGQQSVLDSKSKYKVLCCGRRWGKSFICLMVSIEAMIKGENVAYITPSYALGNRFYKELMKHLQGFPREMVKTNKTSLTTEFINGPSVGSIQFFSGDAGTLDRTVRGANFHKVIIDEAAHIPDLEHAWNNVIYPVLTDHDGDAYIISTPNGKNFFYNLFTKGQKKVDDFEAFHFSTHDNPTLKPEAVERMKNNMPAAAYRQEMLAIPTESEKNPFSDQAIERNIIEKLSANPTICLAIDLGRKVDPTVIIGMDEEGAMTYYESFQLSWPETLDKIKALPSNITKAIDATGLGDVVVGMLENDVSHLRPFMFTNKSKETIIMELINDVEKDLVKFNKPVADEMYTFEAIETSAGNTKYEAQAGFHDDRVFALALCNHYRRKEHVSRTWKLYTVGR